MVQSVDRNKQHTHTHLHINGLRQKNPNAHRKRCKTQRYATIAMNATTIKCLTPQTIERELLF